MFVAALVLIVEFAVASTGALGYQQRFSVVRPCRALRLVPLLDLHPPLKVMIGHIWLSVFNLRDVVLMSLAFLIAVVLAAMLLFPAGTPEGDVVFRSFYVTFMELVYLFVGAVNFPDIMLPATIEMSRWYVLFFALFFVVMVMIVGNLMLAEIWNRYADILEADAVARIRNRRQAVGDAWLYLDVDNDSTLDRNEFMDAVLTVRRVRRTAWGLSPWMSVSELEWMSSALRHQDDQLCDPMVFVLWSIVDKDGNGEIDPGDFFSIVDVLLLSNSERARAAAAAARAVSYGSSRRRGTAARRRRRAGRAGHSRHIDRGVLARAASATHVIPRRHAEPLGAAADAPRRGRHAGCMALSFMYGGLLPQLRASEPRLPPRVELAMAALIFSAVSTALASPREGLSGLAVRRASSARLPRSCSGALRVLAVGLVGWSPPVVFRRHDLVRRVLGSLYAVHSDGLSRAATARERGATAARAVAARETRALWLRDLLRAPADGACGIAHCEPPADHRGGAPLRPAAAALPAHVRRRDLFLCDDRHGGLRRSPRPVR